MLYSCLLQVLDVFKTSALLGLLRADQYIQTILFGGRLLEKQIHVYRENGIL